MDTFANGFSETLNIEATEHRPPICALSFEQVEALSKAAGYRISKMNNQMFTIFHPDGKHGLDNGLYIVWQVRTDGWNLIYYPTLKSRYRRGSDESLTDKMLEHLASFLSTVGYQKEITFPLHEEVITLPNELAKGNNGVLFMFISEFQKKYRSLYQFLKEKMVTPR